MRADREQDDLDVLSIHRRITQRLQSSPALLRSTQIAWPTCVLNLPVMSAYSGVLGEVGGRVVRHVFEQGSQQGFDKTAMYERLREHGPAKDDEASLLTWSVQNAAVDDAVQLLFAVLEDAPIPPPWQETWARARVEEIMEGVCAPLYLHESRLTSEMLEAESRRLNALVVAIEEDRVAKVLDEQVSVLRATLSPFDPWSSSAD